MIFYVLLKMSNELNFYGNVVCLTFSYLPNEFIMITVITMSIKLMNNKLNPYNN